MQNFYAYTSQEYHCDKCGWLGLGEELQQGELYSELVEMKCPNCQEILETVSLPTFDEVLQFGSEEDKKVVKKEISFWEQWEALSLKSTEQLPEIEGYDLIFEVEERKHKRQEYLFIMNNGREIWKEPLMYEYYERFIEIGKILKEKYGERMKDLVPPEYQGWLLGDKLSAPKLIEEFRNSLK